MASLSMTVCLVCIPSRIYWLWNPNNILESILLISENLSLQAHLRNAIAPIHPKTATQFNKACLISFRRAKELQSGIITIIIIIIFKTIKIKIANTKRMVAVTHLMYLAILLIMIMRRMRTIASIKDPWTIAITAKQIYPTKFKIKIIITGILLNYLSTLCNHNNQTIHNMHGSFRSNSLILRDTLLINFLKDIMIKKINNLSASRFVSQKMIAARDHLVRLELGIQPPPSSHFTAPFRKLTGNSNG